MGQMGIAIRCEKCGYAWDSWWIRFDGKHFPNCKAELPEDVVEAARIDNEEGFMGMVRGPIIVSARQTLWQRLAAWIKNKVRR